MSWPKWPEINHYEGMHVSHNVTKCTDITVLSYYPGMWRIAFLLMLLPVILARCGVAHTLLRRSHLCMVYVSTSSGSTNSIADIQQGIIDKYSKLHGASYDHARHGESLYTSMTFFQFMNIDDPVRKVEDIETLDRRFTAILQEQFLVKGTIVLSKEGLNGQLVVPTMRLEKALEFIRNSDKVFSDLFRIMNWGKTINYEIESDIPFPYKRMIFREKSAILTDHMPSELSSKISTWNDNGQELEPSDWHRAIESASSDDDVIVLDCRNSYETEMGTFEGSIPLNTSTFAQTWGVVDGLLKGRDRRSTKVLTFCTGGIRCHKVNAYIHQVLGFQQVAALKQGIVAYERWIEERELSDQQGGSRSKFIGDNFIFDRRRLAGQEGKDGDGGY